MIFFDDDFDEYYDFACNCDDHCGSDSWGCDN